jgi:hypothetical protein
VQGFVHCATSGISQSPCRGEIRPVLPNRVHRSNACLCVSAVMTGDSLRHLLMLVAAYALWHGKRVGAAWPDFGEPVAILACLVSARWRQSAPLRTVVIPGTGSPGADQPGSWIRA